MKQIAVGHHREALQMEFGKAVLAELVLTFLFAFAGVGACIAADQAGLTAGTSLLVAAVAHAFVVFAMISAGLHVSGAHFNPAVTLGLAMGGHVTLIRAASYWLAQLAGSTLACLLLGFLTGGAAMPVHDLTVGMSPAQGVVMEAVMTFSLLFVVYGALVDPRSCETRVVGPLSVGLVVGANVLAGGSYTGASMNPARSFGPAVVAGVWAHLWIYWVGPLLGGALAGLFFENVLIGPFSHVPVGQEL